MILTIHLAVHVSSLYRPQVPNIPNNLTSEIGTHFRNPQPRSPELSTEEAPLERSFHLVFYRFAFSLSTSTSSSLALSNSSNQPSNSSNQRQSRTVKLPTSMESAAQDQGVEWFTITNKLSALGRLFERDPGGVKRCHEARSWLEPMWNELSRAAQDAVVRRIEQSSLEVTRSLEEWRHGPQTATKRDFRWKSSKTIPENIIKLVVSYALSLHFCACSTEKCSLASLHRLT